MAEIVRFSPKMISSMSGNKPEDLQKVKDALRENPSFIRGVDTTFGSILHVAALRSSPEVIRLLVALHADINSIEIYSVTPLALAIRNKNYGAVRELLRLGADPIVADDDDGPSAVDEMHLQTDVQVLIQFLSGIAESYFPDRPLEFVRFLVANNFGVPHLVQLRRIDLLDCLVAHAEVDINQRDATGLSAMQLVLRWQNETQKQVIRNWLVNHGAVDDSPRRRARRGH